MEALSTHRLQNSPYDNLKNDMHKGRLYLPLERKSVSLQILKDERKVHSDAEPVLGLLLYTGW